MNPAASFNYVLFGLYNMGLKVSLCYEDDEDDEIC